MDGVSPETCWALYKYGIINFDTLLHLVGFSLWIILWCKDPRTSSCAMCVLFSMDYQRPHERVWYRRRLVMYWTETEKKTGLKTWKKAQRVKVLDKEPVRQFGEGTPIKGDSLANRYKLDGQGIESRWGARFSAPVQTNPRAHPVVGTGFLYRR
jgi:hypothetical protein